jgi:hypothetical protein
MDTVSGICPEHARGARLKVPGCDHEVEREETAPVHAAVPAPQAPFKLSHGLADKGLVTVTLTWPWMVGEHNDSGPAIDIP